MFRFIFWAIAFYLAFRFIFNFIIPLFRATRQMKAQMKDFREKMEEQYPGGQGNFQQTDDSQRYKHFHQTESKPPVNKSDYLDFEEIK